jgi:hypothetical protein
MLVRSYIASACLNMNIKLSLILVFAIATGISSCKKNDDIPADQDNRTANLNVINASADTLNYYINGTRINNNSSLYPLGSSGYIGVPVGEKTYQFKKAGNPNVLFTLPLKLDSGLVYSVFVAGQTDTEAFTAIDTLTTVADKAVVRFVNASPDAGNLDAAVGDTVKFNTRAFKTTTVFLPVGPGLKRIRIYQAGSSTALIDETRIMQAGRIYTLFTKGRSGGSGTAKFATGLITNR